MEIIDLRVFNPSLSHFLSLLTLEDPFPRFTNVLVNYLQNLVLVFPEASILIKGTILILLFLIAASTMRWRQNQHGINENF